MGGSRRRRRRARNRWQELSIGSRPATAGRAAPLTTHIQVALIGAGGQGQGDASHAVKVPGAKLVAVSDLYDSRLAHAKERWGNDLQTTKDYREILARSDIDAVIIATPDFWHKTAAVDAMNAGKDVYLEKPMIHLYSDGPEIIETARKTNRILQVGSQRVSSLIHKKGQELYQAGAIGQLVSVESWWDRPPWIPGGAFNVTIPSDATPETIDWDRWLGSTPKVPFNANFFFQWRKWREYGSGVAGDLFVHLFSGLHFVTSTIGPTRAVAMGGIRYWKDGRDQPDVLHGLFDYPEGIQSHSAGKLRAGRARNRRTGSGRLRRRHAHWRFGYAYSCRETGGASLRNQQLLASYPAGLPGRISQEIPVQLDLQHGQGHHRNLQH